MQVRFGPFVLAEKLAIGGTAEIFRAYRQSAPDIVLAIKRLLPSLQGDADARLMLAEEGALHRRIEHENVVRCVESGEVDGEPFLALEIVDGPDLHRVLRAAHARSRAIPTPVACAIARALLAALEAVHGARAADGTPLGIVHRDVSPSNVFLAEGGAIMLGDFGVAHASTGRPQRGAPMRGKFAYLAPEQVASEPVDARADLFAVGNILAEMLLGKPLFSGSGQLAVLLAIRDGRLDALDAGPKLPSALDAAIRRALARKPDDRFADAKSFSDAILPFAWQDQASSKREIAALVKWVKETSGELRAIRRTPGRDELRALRPRLADAALGAPRPASEVPPTAPDVMQATPVVGVPARPPVPSLALDSDAFAPALSTPRPAAETVTTAPFGELPSYVRTTDGRLLGPYRYAKLVELVATGQLDEADEVDFNGAGFSRLFEISELARHLAPASAVTARLEGPGTPALSLDAWESSTDPHERRGTPRGEPGIGRALIWIARRAATGVLMASRAERRKELYVRQGRLLHVASSEPGELLGEYLVSRGLLDRAELDFALAVLPRFSGKLGEALGALGLIDPVRIFREIQAQGRDRVAELFRWRTGNLAFYAGEQPAHVDFPLDLPLAPLFEAGASAFADHNELEASWGREAGEVLAVDDALLRGLGWSAIATRILLLTRFPVGVEALLGKLHREGHRRHACEVALEGLRLASLLRRIPA